jgi:hypothetical protein
MSSSFDIRGVTLASALAWARGEIHDTALDASRGEIVFWNELHDLNSYRSALGEIVRLKNSGCRAMIVHACHPAVWHKLEREGSVATVKEQIVWRDAAQTARRYIVPPVVFARWTSKFEKWAEKPRVKTADVFKNVAHIES